MWLAYYLRGARQIPISVNGEKFKFDSKELCDVLWLAVKEVLEST